MRKRSILAFVSIGAEPIETLSNALYAESSDPRDEIFGILGLLPDGLTKRIQPRYTDLPQNVFWEAVVAYIECSGRLDTLLLAGPSWIPDWCMPRKLLRWSGRYCSGNSRANVSYIAQDIMVATGATYDTVELVDGPLPENENDLLEIVQNMWLDGVSHDQTYPTGETLSEACAWTLYSGDLVDRWPNRQVVVSTLAEAQTIFLPSRDSRTTTNLMRELTLTSGSTLFKTSKGYFGLSFNQIRSGDKIAALLGYGLPVILRPQADGTHPLVGSAQIHGLMDGEILLGPLPDRWKVVVNYDRNKEAQQQFVEPTTGATVTQDPRLPPLSSNWQAVLAPDCFWPNKKVDAFRNMATGEVQYSDPRMLPQALRDRGVALEDFALI